MDKNNTVTDENIFIYKKIPRDETRILYINIISGDPTNWLKARKDHYTKFEVVNEYISSQYMVIENPDYAKLKNLGMKIPAGIQPVHQTVMITSVFEFHGFANGNFLK